MNMASIGILLFIFTVIIHSPGNAKKAFINVQCKTENVGRYGQQSLLECVIHPGQDVTDAKIIVVTWKKVGVGVPRTLLVFNEGKTMPQPGFSFAEPSWNDRTMRVSLLITNTAVEDEGSYECTVMTDSGYDTGKTNLKVTAKYSVPTINPSPEKMTQNTDGTLTCQSDGGYPEGILRWFDGDNMEWTKSSEMTATKTEKGLFHLSSTLTLLRGSIFSKYTCVVFNASGDKEDEVMFEIAEVQKHEGSSKEAKGSDSASKIVAPIVVIGSLIVGLLMALLLYRRRSQQARRQSTAPLMGDHQGVHTCESDAEGGDHQELEPTCKDRLA